MRIAMSPSFDSIRSRWASSSGESLLLTRLDAPGVLGGVPFGTPRPYHGMPGRSAYYLATEYLVNAPPAWLKEFGPSAAYTLPSASTATPSPAVP